MARKYALLFSRRHYLSEDANNFSVSFEEQIMSKNKYTSNFFAQSKGEFVFLSFFRLLLQMKVLNIFRQWVLSKPLRLLNRISVIPHLLVRHLFFRLLSSLFSYQNMNQSIINQIKPGLKLKTSFSTSSSSSDSPYLYHNAFYPILKPIKPVMFWLSISSYNLWSHYIYMTRCILPPLQTKPGLNKILQLYTEEKLFHSPLECDW